MKYTESGMTWIPKLKCITQDAEDGTIWITREDEYRAGLSFSNKIMSDNGTVQRVDATTFIKDHFNVKIDSEGAIIFLDEVPCVERMKTESYMISYSLKYPLLYVSKHIALNV